MGFGFGFWVWFLGFGTRVSGFGMRVWGLGFRVKAWSLGFGIFIFILGFTVQGSGCRVLGSGKLASASESGVRGLGSRCHTETQSSRESSSRVFFAGTCESFRA